MTIQLVIDSKFNSQGVKQAEEEVQKLARQVEASLQTSGGSTDSFIAQVQGPSQETIQAIQQQIEKLNQLSAAWRQTAQAQAAAGNLQVAQGLIKEAEAADRTAESLRKLISAQQESNQENEKGGGVLDFINNRFNKFAFGLFVVTGAINTVTRAVRGMTDALIEGASIADRSNAFNVLVEDAGVNAEALRAGLVKASQGALTLDAAMRPTLQLIKAGVPEVAQMSDQLLEIAVASAKLSGDLSQTERIYTTLVRGIVRGSPLLIDNADIYLKLGDAVEAYAKAAGYASAEDLSLEERKIAVAQAVAEQGAAIVELAEKVDSTAITFQNLRTDAEEAGHALLSAAATGVGGAIEWFTDLVLTMGDATSAFYGFSEETQVALRDFREAFAENPFTTFVESVLVGATYVSQAIRGLLREIVEFFSSIVNGSKLAAESIGILFDIIQQGGKPSEAQLQRLNQIMQEGQQVMIDGLNPTNLFNENMENVSDRAKEAAINLGLLTPEMEALTEETKRAADEQARLSSNFNDLSAGIQAAIEARTGLDAQYRDRKQDIEEDIRDKVLDINEDLAEKLGDINEDLHKKLVDLGEKYKEDVTSVAQETAEKLQDIDEDLAEKLNDISEDAGDKRDDAVKNRNKGIEDAHEAHQKKLRDIERKYEAARLKALIDRDARALFEAEQNRKQEKEEANEDLQDKIKEEEEKLQEQMEEINEMEEKRRQEAIEAAEKRRQDALEAQQKELDDLKKALAKQKEEAAKNAAEQRRDALESANERRADAQEHYRDALADLDEWYQEQLLRQKEANLQRKINELEHLEEMGELTQAHLDELRGMWNDYNNFVGGASGSGGGGGGGSISGPIQGGGGTWNGGGSIGGAINQNAGQANQWNMQNMKLQITSNDKTLEEVLRSSTYDYMLETLEE